MEGSQEVRPPRGAPFFWIFLAALLGAGGFYAYRALNKPEDLGVSPEEAKAFQSKGFQERRQETVIVPQIGVERAGLANVVADTGRSAEDLAKPLRAVAPVRPRVIVRTVLRPPAAAGPSPWDLLWRDPAGYLAEKTLLGSPGEFQAWLGDPAKTRAFFAAPLIGRVLNSPASVAQLAGNPAIVSAFVASPAMSDGPTVQALVSSAFLRELLARPGVRSVRADPSMRANLMTQSQVADWLAQNPEAMRLFSDRR